MPSVSTIQVPIALQNLTIAHLPSDLIGDSVFPIVPVPSPEVRVMKYTKSSFFKSTPGELYRDEGAQTKRFNFGVEYQTITPKQISLEVPVADELVDIANMPGQLPLMPQISAVKKLLYQIDLGKEQLISDCIYKQNIWADGTAGGAPTAGTWALDTTANSFVADIFAAKDSIRKNSGKIPNVLVLDYSTFITQQTNPEISDKIKYTQTAVIAADLLAKLLQLDEVIIGRSIVDVTPDNKKNKDSFTSTSIWNPSSKGNAFLYYREPAGLFALSAGFQFRLPYMGSMRYIRGYRDENVRATIYQVTERVEIAPVATDVGYAFKNTILN